MDSAAGEQSATNIRSGTRVHGRQQLQQVHELIAVHPSALHAIAVRTRADDVPQAVLMSVWRTFWQQGRSALDFLSQLLRGTPVVLVVPP
jgi:hypothetical protein